MVERPVTWPPPLRSGPAELPHPALQLFYVQLYHSAKTTPIENASIEWKEKNSPFIKIAGITIPPQQMNTKERFLLAEKFSYSPAHSLVEHQPIGGLNRARIIVYRLLSEFRHQRDSTTLLEPK